MEPAAYANKPAAVVRLQGPLFFGSIGAFKDIVGSPRDEKEDVVVLDFMESRVWDSSALEAISEVAQA